MGVSLRRFCIFTGVAIGFAGIVNYSSNLMKPKPLPKFIGNNPQNPYLFNEGDVGKTHKVYIAERNGDGRHVHYMSNENQNRALATNTPTADFTLDQRIVDENGEQLKGKLYIKGGLPMNYHCLNYYDEFYTSAKNTGNGINNRGENVFYPIIVKVLKTDNDT